MEWEEAVDVGDEETDQEDHRVAARSKRPRAEVCWLGRQEMRAEMLLLPVPVPRCFGFSSVDVMLGLGDVLDADGDAVSVKSTSSHQSISVIFLMPVSRNHFLFPIGAKKWQFGCRRAISVTVGWDR